MTLKQVRAFANGHPISYSVTRDRLVKMGGRLDNNCHLSGVRYGRGILGVKMVTQGSEKV